MQDTAGLKSVPPYIWTKPCFSAFSSLLKGGGLRSLKGVAALDGWPKALDKPLIVIQCGNTLRGRHHENAFKAWIVRDPP